MHLFLAFNLLLLGFSPVQSYVIKASNKDMPEDNDLRTEEDDFSVSALIERANKNVEMSLDGLSIQFGDIAVDEGLRNADKCTSQVPGCKWPRNRDGNVYVPYRFSNQYSSKEKKIIEDALKSFERSTCIRFTPLRNESDYIQIESNEGCYSYVGRNGGRQVLSLQRNGCVYKGVIQHELLHALGFHHEHCRSDRKQHVQILLENVEPEERHNFDLVDTINLGTPYDYGSVMHYGRNFFSMNDKPTIIPIPDRNVPIGQAKEMDPTDILRVKKLYCA